MRTLIHYCRLTFENLASDLVDALEIMVRDFDRIMQYAGGVLNDEWFRLALVAFVLFCIITFL